MGHFDKLQAKRVVANSVNATGGGAANGLVYKKPVVTVDGATQNNFGGCMKEKGAIIGNNLTTVGVDLAQGNVYYYTTNGSGATTAAITYAGGNNVSTWMALGDNVSVSVITKPNGSEYVNAVTIDGGAVTEEWL